MKLAIARGLFVAASLIVASAAVASWQQPDMRVMSSLQGPQMPIKSVSTAVSADQDLLLFILGLQQNRSAFQ